MLREVSHLLTFAVALTAFAQEVTAAEAPVTGPCVAHGDVGHDYLLKVCEYVVREKLPVTSHPNSWKIKRVEEGDLGGHPVIIVYLSCCYLGDVAYFDEHNSILLKYDPGPK
jgi:hypothetical protein